jgi:hypothetical protein
LDWPLAITRNSQALKRIVAALFAMLQIVEATRATLTSPARGSGGLEDRRGVFTLPRHLYAAIMLILRPAESAVRRLIVIAARGLVLKPRATRPVHEGLPAFPSAGTSRIPAFALLDPLKHFTLEDFDQSANPRVSFASSFDPSIFAPSMSAHDEPVDAARLFSRLRALRHALNDLPRQTRRLARWRARRDLALRSKAPFKPMRITPFRPGLPPGWRQRPIHAVDDVLRECHGLAIHALRADTS